MSRKRLENLVVAAGILVVILGALLADRRTRLQLERADVRRSRDVAGNVFLVQEALAEVVALAGPVADVFDEPPRTNPGRGPAYRRHQPIVLEALTGINRGRLLLGNNILHFKPSSNAVLRVGSLVRVSISTSDRGVEDMLIYKPIVRFPAIIFLVAGLLCALIVFLRIRGLLLTAVLVVTMLGLALFLFPMILHGFSPFVAVSIFALLVMTMLVMFLGNVGRKALASMLGACGGLLAAAAVVLIASGPLKLSGFPTTFSLMLRQALSGDIQLNFVSLLACGTIICILGIVLDLGVSVASAVEQLCREKGGAGRALDALQTGMRMSRDVTGTMLLTLMFVWAGTKLHAMMLPQGLRISARELLNTEAMAVEILRLTAGGVGLAITGPVTALVSVGLFGRRRPGSVSHKRRQRAPVQEQPPKWPLSVALGGELALCLACVLLLVVSAPHRPSDIKTDRVAPPVPSLAAADDYHSYAAERLREGDEPRAALALWQALKLDPVHGFAHRDLAHLYANKRWFVPAHSEVGHALKLLPHDSHTHYIAGVVMIWLNQPDEAERELKEALELDPNNARASQALQWMLSGNGAE
ncbi:MAG: YibE/F family protein [Planctomycetes bacterium]|nr:YibE/F family protein [Planctomycetota bacterium]